VGYLVAVGRDDHGVQVPLIVGLVTVGAKGKLAASTEGLEDGAFGGDGELGGGAVEGVYGGVDGRIARGIIRVERMQRTSDLEGERSLAGCGGKFVDGEALVDVFCEAESIETGAGQHQCVGFACLPLAQAGVNVAAHLHEGDVRAEGEDHGLSARAGGGNA